MNNELITTNNMDSKIPYIDKYRFNDEKFDPLVKTHMKYLKNATFNNVMPLDCLDENTRTYLEIELLTQNIPYNIISNPIYENITKLPAKDYIISESEKLPEIFEKYIQNDKKKKIKYSPAGSLENKLI